MIVSLRRGNDSKRRRTVWNCFRATKTFVSWGLSSRGGRRVSFFFYPPPAKTGNRLFLPPPLLFRRRIDPPSSPSSSCFLSLARCPPFFFSSFFSAVSWSGGGGHGGEWVAPCAAEGNKPKASPRPVSQPPFLFFKENIFPICQPLEALTQAPSFKMMPTCAHDFRSLSARLSSEATL